MINSHTRVSSEQILPSDSSQVKDSIRATKQDMTKTVMSNPLSNAEMQQNTSLQTEDQYLSKLHLVRDISDDK